MKPSLIVSAVILFCIIGPAFAAYSVSPRGEWPLSWPKPLEPLRKRSTSFLGPVALYRHYAIPFSNTREFTSAWPSLLKVKSKNAPVFLMSGPNFFLGEHSKAGVIVHCPPTNEHRSYVAPETPIEGSTNPRERWSNTNYLEVVVDEDAIKWSDVALPKGTLVIDERNKPK